MKNYFQLLLFACFVTGSNAQVVDAAPYKTLKCAKSPVMCIAVSPKGNVAAIGLGQYAELWNIDKDKRLHVLKHETPGGVTTVNHVQFSPNGEYVSTVDFKGKRKVWSVKNGKEDAYLKNHTEWLPEPGFIKSTLGLKMTNPAFDRFYTQTEAGHPNFKDIVAKATKKSSIEFHNTGDGSIEQELTFPGVRDRQHFFPVCFDEYTNSFITGSDQGEVYFYKISPRSRY